MVVKRKNNIELLRILSMYMILILHLLRFSGFLDIATTNTVKSFIIWFLESLCFVAVNCYVIISGYFLVDSKFKFKKLINIWLEVMFYSVIIYLILLFTGNISFGLQSFLKSIFPVSLGNYWFVTVYIALYLLSPFINILINNLNQKQYRGLILIIFLLFSVLPTFIPQHNTINYGGSYSISWFTCLYLIAGYLRKYSSDTSRQKKYLFTYILCSLINVIALFICRHFNINFIEHSFLYNYYSVTVLLAAINLFLYFKNLSINNNFINKLITFISPTTFGIYLIHENPNFRMLLWNMFRFTLNKNIIYTFLIIIIIPILLFIIFSMLDKIRTIIFNMMSMKKKYNNIITNLFDSYERSVNNEN